MSAQIVGGVTVGLAFAPVEESVEEIGDRARSFSGTMRSTIRAFKRTWTQTTKPIPAATAVTLLAALRGTLPVACSGDIIGASVNCHPEVTGISRMRIQGAMYAVVSYRLYEV